MVLIPVWAEIGQISQPAYLARGLAGSLALLLFVSLNVSLLLSWIYVLSGIALILSQGVAATRWYSRWLVEIMTYRSAIISSSIILPAVAVVGSVIAGTGVNMITSGASFGQSTGALLAVLGAGMFVIAFGLAAARLTSAMDAERLYELRDLQMKVSRDEPLSTKEWLRARETGNRLYETGRTYISQAEALTFRAWREKNRRQVALVTATVLINATYTVLKYTVSVLAPLPFRGTVGVGAIVISSTGLALVWLAQRRENRVLGEEAERRANGALEILSAHRPKPDGRLRRRASRAVR